MRYFLILTCFLCVLTCLSVATAAPIADSLAFQGRLTDLSDNPVPDGPRDLIISLWTDSLGGTMLHSEVVVVSVSKGLYSTCIGCGSSSFFDIFTDQPLFLQTQLAGQSPMTPRIRLRNTPRALVSSRVRGDISTSPDLLVVGDSITGGSAKINAGLHAAGSAISQGASLVGVTVAEDSSVYEQTGDPVSTRVMIHKIHMGENRIAQTVYPDSTVFDEGGDFGTAKVIHRDLATRNILLSEGRFESSSSTSSFSQQCDASGASQVQEKKGLNAVNVKLARTISSPPGGPLAVDALDLDSDDDGIMDVSSTDSVDANGARRRLSTHNLGSSGQDGVDIQLAARKKQGIIKVTASQNSQSLRCSSSADSAAATMNVDSDHDSDGTPECRAEATVSDKFAQVRGFKVEISGRTSSFGTVCDSTGVSSSLDLDDDGDGTPEGSYGVSLGVGATAVKGTFTVPARSFPNTTTETSASETDGVCRVSTDSDDDGLSDGDASLMVTPTTSSVAIKTKGTGADANRTASSSSTTEVGHITTVSTVDDDGDGIVDQSLEQNVSGSSIIIAYLSKKGYDYYQNAGRNSASLIMRDSMKDTTFSVDGNGRIGIGKPADAVRRIDVAGGAYCDGTTWVNASDVNSKENFEPVDGEELLEKISGLEITKWNYKGNTESEHIGPTAQDFQATFGVGSDGKSISTIDPSGIALAAIKELNKQNQELKVQSQDLKAQNELLKKQLDDLNAKVEKLILNK